MKKVHTNKGFTLAELLIVVAIIAVLVAVAIPTFAGQIEKARESTDISELRSAYAQVVADSLEKPKTGSTATITLKQTQQGWQTDEVIIAGADLKNGADKVDPTSGGTLTVVYTPAGENAAKITIAGVEVPAAIKTTGGSSEPEEPTKTDSALKGKVTANSSVAATVNSSTPTVADKALTDLVTISDSLTGKIISVSATVGGSSTDKVTKKDDSNITIAADAVTGEYTITLELLKSTDETTDANNTVSVDVTVTVTQEA